MSSSDVPDSDVPDPDLQEMDEPNPSYRGSEIAVVGMAGRFPGAADVGELWTNLAAGIESIRLLSPQELDLCGVPAALRARPGYVPAVSQLAGYDLFDAAFF